MQSLGKDVDSTGGVEERRLDDGKKEGQTSEAATDGGGKGSQKDVKGRTNGGCHTRDFNTETLEEDFGRLVVEEGRSRYVSNSFWASLSDEVRVVVFYPYVYHVQTADARNECLGCGDEGYPGSCFRR